MTYQLSLSPSRILRAALACLLVAGLAACTARDPGHPQGAPWDPYEERNRKVHQFNKGLDRSVLRPVSRGYSAFMPDDIETAVSRFSFNLSIPQAVVNNILQGNMRGATEDTYRFVVNTTIGLGGFFDPATELGMPEATDTDFGETLHVWGVPEGAYVETPVFGPSTERDYAGSWVDLFTNPFRYVLESPESYIPPSARVSSTLSQRGRYGDSIDAILYDSADSYAQARSLYLQNRRFKLGGTSGEAYVDPYEDPYGATYEDPYDDPYAE
ncbi:MAG: VacJ family lipoprotein [Roseovarius sp.]|uniref:MlaA family lipoprotein n=1 Tax=Roseovarius sp. TaxID=1486281 RepID=UPI0032EB0813